jgi:hypothetical protein
LIYFESDVSDSEIPNKQRRIIIWLIKRLHAKIAEQNSFSMKASRHSTKRRGSKTNHRDARIAELQENSSREITEAVETDTK